MTDENYSVMINRREGIVEITGPDKDWIAEQLDRLSAVYEVGPPDDEIIEPDGGVDGTNGGDTLEKPGDVPDGKTTAPRRRGKSGFRGTRVADLEAKLTADVRANLEAYVEERRPNFKEATDQAVIIATFLEDELQWPDGTSADDLYTVFSVMGWPAPNPRNALSNAKNRKGYFSGQRQGKYPLTHTGERFGRHDSKAATT